MSEVTQLSQPLPPTVSSLSADLRQLGVTLGMTLIVHSSLKAIVPWVIGGAQAVILALARLCTLRS